MKVVESLPHAIREVEHCWIAMSDGTRLAARLWIPEDAEARPVPAVLEYIPYGKREGTRERDEPMHRYFAGHGYAAVRVDLRGSGDSEGILRDEYLEQEEDDGLEVIAWIAEQPWCDGSVGMIGKSWGGFNALQLAARRPPALRGIITVCSSDDRYADDAHYMGGCLLNENFRWGASLFQLVALPPDPELVGPGWKRLWRERLEAAEPFVVRWLRHPLRDAYWRRGSVCEDYARIECPVYAIGGWADGYSNAVPRLLSALPGPRKGLVGPWAHLYPHEGLPGPAIGFLQEALRWWDACLRGRDDGILAEPVYRAWMPESVIPTAFQHERPGRWVAEAAWPSKRIERRRLVLGVDGLGGKTGALERSLRSPQTVGLAGGAWCAFGAGDDLPTDQREDDANSICFDSRPLPQRLEILGDPAVELSLSVDRPSAFLAVRLVDVFPDGTSARVSYGLLNLTHASDHASFAPIEPGARRKVRVQLNDVGHAFPPGHRIRVAVSTAYWPLVWPSPEPVELRVLAGAGWLELPVRPPCAGDAGLRPFPPPEAAPGPEVRDLHPGGATREVARDPETGEVVITSTLDLDDDGGPSVSVVDPIRLETGYGVVEQLRLHPDAPRSAEVRIEHQSLARRGAWEVRVRSLSRVTACGEAIRVEAELRAYEGAREVFAKRWDESVPRRGS